VVYIPGRAFTVSDEHLYRRLSRERRSA